MKIIVTILQEIIDRKNSLKDHIKSQQRKLNSKQLGLTVVNYNQRLFACMHGNKGNYDLMEFQ